MFANHSPWVRGIVWRTRLEYIAFDRSDFGHDVVGLQVVDGGCRLTEEVGVGWKELDDVYVLMEWGEL